MLDINTQKEYENHIAAVAKDCVDDTLKLNDGEEWADQIEELVRESVYEGSDVIYTYDAIRILLHSNNEDAWEEIDSLGAFENQDGTHKSTAEILTYMATWAYVKDLGEAAQNYLAEKLEQTTTPRTK